LKYFCVIFLKTVHKWFILSKIVVKDQGGSAVLPFPGVLLHPSEHEVENVSLIGFAGSSSVGDLGGFVSGEVFTLRSDSVTGSNPVGLLGGGFGVSGLTSFEAKGTGGPFSVDDLGLPYLSVENGLADGVETKGRNLSDNVERLELKVDGVVEVSNIKLVESSNLRVIVVCAVGAGVVVGNKRNTLHHKKEESTDNPDDNEHLSHSVVEHMKDGESPSKRSNGPPEQHSEPKDHAHFQSHEVGACEGSPESHDGAIVYSVVVHVLPFVNVHVVKRVETSEGSI
jgi:hypothetical protein